MSNGLEKLTHKVNECLAAGARHAPPIVQAMVNDLPQLSDAPDARIALSEEQAAALVSLVGQAFRDMDPQDSTRRLAFLEGLFKKTAEGVKAVNRFDLVSANDPVPVFSAAARYVLASICLRAGMERTELDRYGADAIARRSYTADRNSSDLAVRLPVIIAAKAGDIELLAEIATYRPELLIRVQRSVLFDTKQMLAMLRALDAMKDAPREVHGELAYAIAKGLHDRNVAIPQFPERGALWLAMSKYTKGRFLTQTTDTAAALGFAKRAAKAGAGAAIAPSSSAEESLAQTALAHYVARTAGYWTMYPGEDCHGFQPAEKASKLVEQQVSQHFPASEGYVGRSAGHFVFRDGSTASLRSDGSIRAFCAGHMNQIDVQAMTGLQKYLGQETTLGRLVSRFLGRS